MGTDTCLVCEHLENISREALEEGAEVLREFVRDRQGVYALYRRAKLYYVGLASDLRTRLGQHLKDRHADSWDRFSVYLTVGGEHLRELESLILRIVQPKPPGNEQKAKFTKSKDLRGDFRRKVRAWADDRLQAWIPTCRPVVAYPERTQPRRGLALLRKPLKLRGFYHGTEVRAEARRDGLIFVRGYRTGFATPFAAAVVACPGQRPRGWAFWQYERSPGCWAPLAELKGSWPGVQGRT